MTDAARLITTRTSAALSTSFWTSTIINSAKIRADAVLPSKAARSTMSEGSSSITLSIHRQGAWMVGPVRAGGNALPARRVPAVPA